MVDTSISEQKTCIDATVFFITSPFSRLVEAGWDWLGIVFFASFAVSYVEPPCSVVFKRYLRSETFVLFIRFSSSLFY
jgi:hypothetical protein